MRAPAAKRPAPVDLPLGRGDDEPEERRGDDHQERGGVDGADAGHHQRGQRGVPPLRARRRAHRQADDPAQAGPRQEHRRGAGDVGEEIGRELVDERGGQGGHDAEPEAAGRPQHAGPGQHGEGADPQSVDDPVREPTGVAQPVPRALRPEVGDDLVRDPARELPGVEGERSVGDQASGVQVEVELGVGRHPAGRRRQRRHVGQEAEQTHRQPHGPAAQHLQDGHQGTAGRNLVRCLRAPSAPALAVRRCGDVPSPGPPVVSPRWARNQS